MRTNLQGFGDARDRAIVGHQYDRQVRLRRLFWITDDPNHPEPVEGQQIPVDEHDIWIDATNRFQRGDTSAAS